MNVCKRCLQRGKVWVGDDPVCAFTNGIFDTNNWNCATMNALRDIAKGYNDYSVVWSARDDSSAASIGVILIPNNSIVQGYLVMSWYKNRGRTGQAYIFNDDEVPHPVTLQEAEAILDALQEK